MKTHHLTSMGIFAMSFTLVSQAEVQVLVDRLPSGADPFQFESVSFPSKGDAAASGEFSVVYGSLGPNGDRMEIGMLNDDELPGGEDMPSANFFFGPGTVGGRLVLDLGEAIEVEKVNTYSWHRAERGPQVYSLYVSEGTTEGFDASPEEGIDPLVAGWTRLISVDTRPEEQEVGGQYGVSISDSEGPLGSYRYLLFQIEPADENEHFSNTFYSEIDVLAVGADVEAIEVAEPKLIEFADGRYKVSLDTSAAPDLEEWTVNELAPVIEEWYPKLVELLPSEGFEAPTEFTILFRNDMGGTPASAGGGRINCNSDWFRSQLEREAKGAVVHEMVHVVQQYRRNRERRNPGWLVEGLADYIRWFLYEPETGGGQISRRGLERAHYNGSYRITGNFLDWVARTYDEEIAQKLNAAMREGRYEEALWKTYTGKTVEELNQEWRKELEARIAAREAARAEEE